MNDKVQVGNLTTFITEDRDIEFIRSINAGDRIVEVIPDTRTSIKISCSTKLYLQNLYRVLGIKDKK